MHYKCSDLYAPDCDGAVRWDDPDIGIDWGADGAPVLSDKDAQAPRFWPTSATPFVCGGRRMKILVTGGAGFIGSAVVRQAIARGHQVVNLDALTYAACLDNVAAVAGSNRYRLRAGRHPRPRGAGPRSSPTHRPDAVMHLAAESHVDRSIDGPGAFIADQHHRHLQPAGGRARLLDRAGQARRLPLPPHLDRRGLRLARARRACSPRTRPTTRAAPIRPPRPPPTIWCAPGTRPTACRWC